MEASERAASAMPRNTGTPAARSTSMLALCGNIDCTTTGLRCALTTASCAAAISRGPSEPGSVV